VSLAIIPDVDLRPLADLLRGRSTVGVIQHGCDHINRSVGGEHPAEFHPDTATTDVAERINAAWSRLSGALSADPIYAPPWNTVTPNLLGALRDTPIRALSAYGARREGLSSLEQINTHLDILLWDPPRFRGEGAALGRLWRLLRSRRLGGRWDEPIGLLTHHRNLDEAAWRFLDKFLARLTSPGAGVEWRAAAELIGEAASQGPASAVRAISS
jgi:hypothetical protein